MSKSAILSIKIVSDAKDGTAGLDAAAGKVEKFQSRVSKATLPAAAITAAAGVAAKSVINYASDAQQAVGGVDTVFGKHAAQVKSKAAEADAALGLSEAAYNTLAAGVGGSLKAAGFAQDQLGGKTDDLMTRAADLASVFGGDTTSATAAMGAALRGEFDSLEQYGVFLNAASVEAELARLGQDKLTGSALDAAKKQATYNLIMDQSADYAGNFAREADTAAGAEQRAAAARENAAAKLGSVLLPAWTALMVVMGQAATFVERNSTAVMILAGVVVGLAGAVLAVNAALRIYTAVTAAWTVVTKGAAIAQKVLNAAMRAHPIGLVITAVALLVAGFVLLYQRSETFRAAVDAAAAGIAAAFRAVSAFVVAVWRAAMSNVQTNLRGMGAAFRAVVAAVRGVWRAATAFVGSVFRAAMSNVQANLRGMGAAFRAAVNAIRSAWRAATAFVGSVFRAAMSNVRTNLAGMGNAFRSAVNAIRSAWRAATSFLRSVWSAAMDAARAAANRFRSGVSNVMSGIRSVIDRVRSALSGLGAGFRNAGAAGTGAMNRIIGTIRNMLGWISDAMGRLGSLRDLGSRIGSGVRSLLGWQRVAPRSAPADGSPFYLTAAEASRLIPAMPLAPPARGSRGGVGRSLTVNVFGAIDPNRTARRIREILDADDRRDGGDNPWN